MDLTRLVAFGSLTVLVSLGLTLWTCGAARRTAAVDVLARAAVDAAVTLVAFWAVGAPLLFSTRRILGFDSGLLMAQSIDSPRTAAGEVYGWAVALIGSAVVGGAVAGRGRSRVGVVAAVVVGGVVFPIVGHWEWFGWLREWNVVDFGGAAALHLPAAVFALVAAAMVGRRAEPDFAPHSWPLMATGLGLTVVGWMPYLMGGLAAHPTDFNQVDVIGLSLTITSTVLAGAGGLFGGLLYAKVRRPRRGDRPPLACGASGLLGGLVAISAGCVSTGNFGALLIGVMAGVLVPVATVVLDRRMGIDDPAGLIAVHGVGAVWGLIAAAAFAGNQAINRPVQARLFVGQGLAIVSATAVASVAAAVTFGLLRALGPLRVDATDETAGLDTAVHGTAAYDA